MDNLLCHGIHESSDSGSDYGKIRLSTTFSCFISVTCGCCGLGTIHNKKLTYWHCFPFLGWLGYPIYRICLSNLFSSSRISEAYYTEISVLLHLIMSDGIVKQLMHILHKFRILLSAQRHRFLCHILSFPCSREIQ